MDIGELGVGELLKVLLHRLRLTRIGSLQLLDILFPGPHERAGLHAVLVVHVVRHLVPGQQHVHVGRIAGVFAVEHLLLRKGMRHAPLLLRLHRRLVESGEKNRKKGHIIIERQAPYISVPLPKLMAETAVVAFIAANVFHFQFILIHRNIAEHRKTSLQDLKMLQTVFSKD